MRRKPYTEIGIKRVPCFRCGKPSVQQWQICSLNNEYKGLCQQCDIDLNRVVLSFLRINPKDVHSLIADYIVCKDYWNVNPR